MADSTIPEGSVQDDRVTASDTTALVLAVAANVACLALIARMWHHSRRHQRVARSPHPSVRPPLAVGLVPDDGRCDVRIDALPGSPPLAVDIVSFRHAVPESSWDSVPLVDPVEIAPGGHVRVPTTLPVDTPAADVVVAWTARHLTGDVEGSRLFRLPPERDAPVPPPAHRAVLGGRPALGLAVLLIASGLLVVASALDDEDRGSAERPPSIAPPATTGPSTPLPSSPPASTSPAASTSSPSTVVPVTTAISPAATATSTTAAAPASTVTTAPTSTVTAAATTPTSTPPSSPRVSADGRIGPCRFADECLIVGFRIEGFASRPQEYVCEFEDGSRFTFRFDSDGVDEACATGSASAAITVEVAGNRSETITRADASPG